MKHENEKWGVWCLEDGAWCTGTVGSHDHAAAHLPIWQSGKAANVDPGRFRYELRKVVPACENDLKVFPAYEDDLKVFPAYEDDLKVFTLDREEWVVARDPADAQAVYTEQVGKNFSTAHDWLECHPADEISWSDDEDNPYRLITFAELSKRGRGYLGGVNE